MWSHTQSLSLTKYVLKLMNLQAALRWLYNISKLNLFSWPYFLSVFVIIVLVSVSFIESSCQFHLFWTYQSDTPVNYSVVPLLLICSSTWRHSQVSHFRHLKQGGKTQTYPEELVNMAASKTRTGESKTQIVITLSLFSHRFILPYWLCSVSGLCEQRSHLCPWGLLMAISSTWSSGMMATSFKSSALKDLLETDGANSELAAAISRYSTQFMST